jgi:hypothetical protein
MLSIVCVYNNEEVLETRLLASLKNQKTNYDLILVKNDDGSFPNASSALNYGASQAKGNYLIFAHQDVSLLGDTWLENVEILLNKYQPTGWVGNSGVTDKGKAHGFMIDSARLFGEPFEGLIEVQTLDEVLLICQRQTDEDYFDPNIPSWHAYGVDACCQAIREGKKNYVLSFPIWHDSKRINVAGLAESHHYVWEKHKKYFNKIFTTCGVLPNVFIKKSENLGKTFVKKLYNRFKSSFNKLNGNSSTYLYWYEQILEEITKDFSSINCFHKISEPLSEQNIEVTSFAPFSDNPRKINHIYLRNQITEISSNCVVIAADYFNKPYTNNELDNILELCKNKKLIVCLLAEDGINQILLNQLNKLKKASHLTETKEYRKILVYEI